MSEFFFRDTIPEFWELIRAKYHRLHSILGREPFNFTAPDFPFPISILMLTLEHVTLDTEVLDT